MKKAIMKKWVKALRSGKFKQGVGNLKRDGKHCCLGVLCDMASAKGICQATNEETEEFTQITDFDGCIEVLPKSVMNWAGLEFEDGRFAHHESLASLNDDGKRFKTIAKIIEKNWEAL